ncbi:MAG: helical backbone metal receptor [candidate division WOR-3 bacterium]
MFFRVLVLFLIFGCESVNDLKSQNLRIISLVPSATDIIYLLNGDDVLVGISNQDYYKKEKVGDMINPDYEKIIKLKPSLVILTMPLHRKVAQELSKLNIDTISISPESIEDIFNSILKLGKILNKEDRAKFVVDSLKSILDSLKVDKTLSGNKVFYEIWDNPLWTAGNKTFINDILKFLNLENIFSDKEGYFSVLEEEVIKRNPDIIIIAHSNVKIEDVKNRKFWNNINAIKNNQVYIVDENLFNKPGPNFVSAIKFLKSTLYSKGG